MDSATRNALEQLADSLESIGRTPMYRKHKEIMSNLAPKLPSDLFVIAWDIKQIARFGTNSFGI